jgi:hypothetical protein
MCWVKLNGRFVSRNGLIQTAHSREVYPEVVVSSDARGLDANTILQLLNAPRRLVLRS